MEKAQKGNILTMRGLLITMAYIALYFVLFYTIPGVQPVAKTKVFLLIVSLAAMIICNLADKTIIEKYKGKGYRLAIVLVALYASLASFAQRFFFEGYSRMHFSLTGFICCLSAFLWFLPLICAMLCLMEKFSLKEDAVESMGGKKYFLLVFSVYCIWQIVVFLEFRPGGFPPDSVSQLFQAYGYEKIHDWHPALHTLFFRLVLRLTGNRAMMIVAVQIFAFTALIAGFVSLFVRWGANRWLMAAAGLIFLMMPNNVLSEIGAVKDFPYTLSLLWATLLLLKLATDIYIYIYAGGQEKRSNKSICINLACLSIATFLIFGFRHNGIIPAVFIIILLVILTVRHFDMLRWKALVAASVSVLMMVIYKGPVFKIFDVYPNTASPYTTMLCAVGSCVNQGLPLSEEATKIMESVIPLEDWAEYYNKYEGHDEYNWGRGEDKIFDTEHITAKDAFRVYLEALFKYPDVVIKDRLDGMDILWDVHNPKDGFNAKSFDTIYFLPYSELFFNTSGMEVKGYQQYAFPSKFADFYRDFVNTPIFSVSDMLLWRTGSYIILMLTLLVYIAANKKCYILAAAVPLAGNVFGLLFLLYHQSFRYIYAIQPMILVMLVAALLARKGTEKQKA